jgi:hypothetical protein
MGGRKTLPAEIVNGVRAPRVSQAEGLRCGYCNRMTYTVVGCKAMTSAARHCMSMHMLEALQYGSFVAVK